MSKVKTGIPGFDSLVKGGIPKGSTVLVTGTPGTAKSIFSLQFLYNGAMKYKEKSLYVSFEQPREDIIKQSKQFGWKVEELEKKGLLHVMFIKVKDINHLTLKTILDYVEKNKIKRLVIDSLSTLSIVAPVYSAISDLFLKEMVTQDNIFSPSFSEKFIEKRFIYHFIGQLQELPLTTFLISEVGSDSKFLSSDKVSEFLCDGIIQMIFESMGGAFSRSLLVRKMRHTKNDEDIHPVEISKVGLIIHSLDGK